MLTLYMMEILDGEQTRWVSVPELLHYGGGFSSGMFLFCLKQELCGFLALLKQCERITV